MTGNAGANALGGLAGNDVLAGLSGRDTLTAGAGDDRLTGGRGQDTFVFSFGGGSDRISDFSVAGHDTLRLNDNLWARQVLTAAEVVSQFATIRAGEVVFDFGAAELRWV